MKIVGIDSMVLVYARVVPVRDEAIPDLRRRSVLLLRYLSRIEAKVILPTIAIAELLVPVPEKNKGSVVAELSKRFVCPTFDLKATAIASRLWAQHKSLPADQQYSNRHILKADAMIIGSAISAGATEFYSHDKVARAMAGLMINAHDLPIRDPDGEFEFPDDE